MFNTDENSGTDEWELDLDIDNYTPVKNDRYRELIEDSNILYALRKIGIVTADVEAEAIEFLRDEGAGV
jgi:hypothetical protein